MNSTPQRLLLCLIGLHSFLFSGCATIIKGTHQEIPISSDPSGASVSIDGQRQGSTPTKLNLSRKQAHVVTLEMEGYDSENVNLKPSIGGAVAGNILAGGLIGWGVDASTGAQYNLHPSTVDVRLRKVPQSAKPVMDRQGSGISGLLSELETLEKMKRDGMISSDEYTKTRAAVLQKYQG